MILLTFNTFLGYIFLFSTVLLLTNYILRLTHDIKRHFN